MAFNNFSFVGEYLQLTGNEKNAGHNCPAWNLNCL
jgi:hypothetical protein